MCDVLIDDTKKENFIKTKPVNFRQSAGSVFTPLRGRLGVEGGFGTPFVLVTFAPKVTPRRGNINVAFGTRYKFYKNCSMYYLCALIL